MLASRPLPPPSLAIIIPTLDEEAQLAAMLPALSEHAEEIVVSDGGSRDGTRELAACHGARVVEGSPGRGVQLRRGVTAARGDVLLFLHADTRLPGEAFERIRAAVGRGAAAGGFTVLFDPPTPLLRIGSHLVNLRTRLTRLPLGDQGQWATRAAYEAVGGFRDWPILEDLDFMRRVKRYGPVTILSGPARTSSRRFRQLGFARTVATNWLIWTLYAVGVSPHKLARLYRR
ncbi:MAG: TIGR04283 family arsenosugar biosynthesis glycosyltransferase [Thermoanaerobaculia bacterium]